MAVFVSSPVQGIKPGQLLIFGRNENAMNTIDANSSSIRLTMNTYGNVLRKCERCAGCYTDKDINKENKKREFLYKVEHSDGQFYAGLCPRCLRALEKFMDDQYEAGSYKD